MPILFFMFTDVLQYRRSGTIVPRKTYDISELYSEIYFDGDVWRAISDKHKIAEAGVWEVCAIFEMCRPRCAGIDGGQLKLSDTLTFKGVEFKLDTVNARNA